ncbi:MAG: ZIP family metal transporter [Candidatus Methanosuratincola verstraetei]|jgi:ZIP family zinc transporter
MDGSTLILGWTASLVAGLATGLGALAIIVPKRITERSQDLMMGFSGGVMLAAAGFSLIVPAVEIGGHIVAVLGIGLGALALHLIDRTVPHIHPQLGPEGMNSKLPRVWLVFLAMSIHNIPEGLAVGMSFGGEDIAIGIVTATAIAIQNVPEGLIVALVFFSEGESRAKAIGYATLSGLVEPVAGLAGITITSSSSFLLPLGLAFAGGAMLFVVSDEMIPESHKKGFEREATLGFVGGFLVMMIIEGIFL